MQKQECGLDDMPKIVDRIIEDLVKTQSWDAQIHLERAIEARGLFAKAGGLLKGLKIYDAGDGCTCPDDCGGEGEECGGGERCDQYDKCILVHRRYMRLIGGWKFSNEEL